MTDELYGIEQRDVGLYRNLIQRERNLRQPDFEAETSTRGVQAAIIVTTPGGWEPGKVAMLRREVGFPFCYEVSINGYPGFGTLDVIRGRIRRTDQPLDDLPRDDYAFEFNRLSTVQEIIESFPLYWRSRIRVTGGPVIVDQLKTENPAYVEGSSEPEFLFEDVTINVGRWLIGFTEEPFEFVVAKTDPLTNEEIEAAESLIIDGSLYVHPTDENGFFTNNDERVTARVRRVPFLVAPVVTDCYTLVDTSQPSPIARGALALVSRVSGLGLTIISVEPRVYQDLGGVFTEDVFTAAAELLAALEDEEGQT